MNKHASHTPLPPEVQELLEQQPPADRQALREAWHVAEAGNPTATRVSDARKAQAWRTVEARMNETGAPSREPVRRSPLRLVTSRSFYWAAAAVVAVLLGVGISYWTMPITVSAPYGRTATVALPDGSNVVLNSGSSLTYRRLYRIGDRNVSLVGEGFFSVEHSGRPFVVKTFNATTRVMGTRFNVRAWQGDLDAATTVVVESGKVRLAGRNGDDAVVLTAGMASHLISGADRPTAPETVDLDRALIWRSGGLAFTAEPFGVVLDELQRRFDVEIQTDLAIRQILVNLYKHDPEDAETIIGDLAQANGLYYRETAHGFEIYRQ